MNDIVMEFVNTFMSKAADRSNDLIIYVNSHGITYDLNKEIVGAFEWEEIEENARKALQDFLEGFYE